MNARKIVFIVMEWLGHTNVQTPQRYAHLDQDRLLAAVEVLEQ